MSVSLTREEIRERMATDGVCVIPGVLTREQVAEANAALDRAVEETRRMGESTHTDTLDPNAQNVRVYNLPDFDPLFIELLRWPIAAEIVEDVIGPTALVSNFTANIALPGSKSMNMHSDQALTMPPPWLQPMALNIIWCLDDVHEANGATRYLPGSHRYETPEALPADALARMRAFEAPAGSIVAMEGRIWHTSGANVTASERRAMMFAYYSADYIRQQANWEASLSPEVKDALDPQMRAMFGLGPKGNIRLGSGYTRLAEHLRHQA
jgi:ectoine hydroxylase-related dioxygenase (phytanoyl-CoA dioxygenase family)